MEYSVQDLAKMSGVSIRTLHHYDEIGLLAPNMRMASGKRYYGIREFLCLMHIVSLKGLGFSLEKIRSILGVNNTDKLRALRVQKEILIKEIDRLKNSIDGVDAMIAFYKGEGTMSLQDAQANFESFHKDKQEYVKYFDEAALQEKGKEIEKFWELQIGEERFVEFKKRQQELALKMDLQNRIEWIKEQASLYADIQKAMSIPLTEDSEEVQRLMQRHYDSNKKMYPMEDSKEMYFATRVVLCSLPDFFEEEALQKTAASRAFTYKAMGIFAENHFSQ